jgi:hypothetical protein
MVFISGLFVDVADSKAKKKKAENVNSPMKSSIF